jgi:hypothetical protein
MKKKMNDDQKKAFEALGYVPEEAPDKPVPGGKASTKPDPPEGPPPIPPGGDDDEPISLRMRTEDFEPEFGPEAHRDEDERTRKQILDSLPSGPIKVLKLLFVDQVRDEYDEENQEYLGSKFVPQYIAISSYEILVPVLAYKKLKDGTEGGIPWGRIAAYEVLTWSKSKPE